MNDIDKQSQYLASLVKMVPKEEFVETIDHPGVKLASNILYPRGTVQSTFVSSFYYEYSEFLKHFLDTVIRKRDSSNMVSSDGRGHHPPGCKRPEDAKERLRNYITSFPVVLSHYCCSDTSKQYLASDFNLEKMYSLYVVDCDAASPRMKPKKKFNFSFHSPKNDECDHGFHFRNLIFEKQEEQHDLAKNVHCHLLEFDLEAVWYCPSINAKAIFYKRRLAVYNLTEYNTSKKKTPCLLKELQNITDGEPIYLFSDTCGGQNRNANMCTMLLHAVKTLNIPTIDHCVFKPGHSQLECDSVPANIERTSKNVHIYNPSGTVVQTVSKGRLYTVVETDQEEFLDFKTVQKELLKNKKVDSNGNILWLKVVHFQYWKSDLLHVYLKYDNDEDFKSFATLVTGPPHNPEGET
ncbi:hypothetical protein PR048_021638 [Dryococelus australis]|uniref:Uncharacterized protein n=1 Tax=Dryococelus australis TaxID=614101 RepID=A0ABQ9GYU2_9NEOP|nr:hypothetical protein PR048_021638 [Dryococelus australis]